MKHILGISCFYHDSAAALIRDGEILAAAQEERFSRKKHDPGFPTAQLPIALKKVALRLKILISSLFTINHLLSLKEYWKLIFLRLPQAYASSFRQCHCG